MANPKSKVLPQIIEIYLFVLLTFCFDVFYYNFMGDARILGTNLYGYIMGLLCVGVVCVAKKKSVQSYGAVLKPKKIFKGFYRGALFSLAPTAVVAGFFALIYAAFGVSWARVRFLPPNHYPAGDINIIIVTAIYGVSLLFSVFAKEFFFRGYVIKTARLVYTFFDANVIQIILSVPMQLIIHARNIVIPFYSDEQLNPLLMISVGLFWLVHEAMTAFKWGLLARATRDIWASFFDHFFYNFITFSLLLCQAKVANYSTMVKLLLVQAISLGMVWIFYKKKRTENDQQKLQHEINKIERRQRHERGERRSLTVDEINERNAQKNADILEDYTRGDVQRRIDDFSNANLLRHRHISSKPDDYKDEELMDLKDIKVDDFYLEYAKEVERKRQVEKDSAAQKIQIPDDEEE